MQVSPLLTPIHVIKNIKKRSRSDDDFESNYFKKRLISTPLPSKSSVVAAAAIHTTLIEDTTLYNDDTPLLNDTTIYMMDDDKEPDKAAPTILQLPSSKIHMVNVNGTILPMEHNNNKSGETKYFIPDFVVKDNTSKQKKFIPSCILLQGQLIRYQLNTLLPLTPPTTPPSDDIDDEEDEYEPMDID